MIVLIVGTRPELIKTAPVVAALSRRGAPFAIIHSGQHYTPSLDDVFFRELGLPPPRVNLGVGSRPAADQIAAILSGSAAALASLSSDGIKAVLVQGDTNTVLAGALAAHTLGIPVAHLEAGLRSDDWTMPEEANRALVGRLASVHFCPSQTQASRLAAEGIVRGVFVVGNTVVDATLAHAAQASARADLLPRLGLMPKRYALLTLHRPGNVDDPTRFAALVAGLSLTAQDLGLALAFPVHPRTRTRARAAGLEGQIDHPPFVTFEPVGYLDMLALLQGAALVFTDSGGVQEEACTLRVPCVTLRPNTERPETVEVGANLLCDGTDAGSLRSAADAMQARPRDWTNPLGDGTTGERVAEILLSPDTRWMPSGAP